MDQTEPKRTMKPTIFLAVSVAMLAAATMAQTEPPVCDPPDTIPPTGDQGTSQIRKQIEAS